MNYRFLGNMALVGLYQYWEGQHRSNVAASVGLQKDDLKAPIMGDLRLLRISIIHHGGIALKDVERCEILKWFSEGDEIFLDEEKFKEIIFYVKSMLADLRRKAAGA